MQKNLIAKIKESLGSVLPVTAVVFLLTVTIVPVSGELFFMFFVGTVMLIVGIGMFTLGADTSMIIIGEKIGARLTQSRKLGLIFPICFIIGVLVTVAEPDLTVLAEQTPIVEAQVMIWSVGIGVGIFLVLAFLRIFLQFKISVLFIIFYSIVFIFACSPLISADFIPAAFDSGGVTTGPITVPFIMALGVGLSSIRGDKTSEEDSFGLVALCSIGPIITVLILGALNSTESFQQELSHPNDYDTIAQAFGEFIDSFPHYFKEVASAILPVIIFFLIFDVIFLRLDRKTMLKIFVGLAFTYMGLVIFLTGANVGFMPIGQYIGESLAGGRFSWVLVPVGMLIGYFIVSAEPAVHVLKQQVETITEGRISARALGTSLALGVAVSVGISMIRVITGISIMWFLIPGYALSLIVTFFVPTIFTSVAFDAGGVASGPLTATFLLPLAMGACSAEGGDIAANAFGIVAMVAMTPLLTIQILGLISRFKTVQEVPQIPQTAASVAVQAFPITLDESCDKVIILDVSGRSVSI
ncbi:MAG: DUF1538 domain-containing protein [Oscillospiraceae bacterium]|nr:DUF1538 domain-containing protein [Oscillospiraceae bacterium]